MKRLLAVGLLWAGMVGTIVGALLSRTDDGRGACVCGTLLIMSLGMVVAIGWPSRR